VLVELIIEASITKLEMIDNGIWCEMEKKLLLNLMRITTIDTNLYINNWVMTNIVLYLNLEEFF
jgi:hypothetical protein